MQLKIGVFGSGVESGVQMRNVAWVIGLRIAAKKGILVTGGCGGLPHEAAQAAAAGNGLVLGISPAMNLREHVEKYGFPADSFYTFIFTGIEKKGRNPISLISLRTCDAAIFIGGRTGTLNEYTIARDEKSEGFVIGLLRGSGGITDKLSELEDFITRVGKGSKVTFVTEKDPLLLVNKVFDELNRKREEE
jgi:uncharacterized protein (TIGR00725 family)